MKESACVLAFAVVAVACTHTRASAEAGGSEDVAQARDDARDASATGDSGAGWGALSQLAMSSILGDEGESEEPYEEPTQSPEFEEGEEHFAIVELSQPVVELRSFSLFGGTSGIELRRLVETLAGLADTPEVEGLVLRASEPVMSLSAAEELRRALVSFKDGGGRERPVYCHADRASMISYYVLSACDHIALAPLGDVSIAGVTATPIHIRGLLDKIGVRPQFLQIGDHKGAGEPLTREEPSREQRETLEHVLDNRYRALVRGIARGRGMQPARVRALIDQAVFPASEAQREGLVDAVAPFSAYREARLGGAPWVRRSFGERPVSADMDQVMEWLGLAPPQRPQGERLAIVHMVGPIVEGDGRGRSGLREEIASRRIISALRVLADDDAVGAVVVRVDSPGGSALASEQIWLALSELAEAKPLVVSMGEVAASGGYYIASAADKIYGLETTLTGSIGVAGGKLVIDEGLDKLGISAHPKSRGERALLGSPIVEWDSGDRELISSLMRDVYDQFVRRVAAGRDMSPGAVREVAGGRLWSGRAAARHGLVDELGGLSEALTTARELGGLAPDTRIEVYPPAPSVLDMLSGGGVSAGSGAGTTSQLLARARAELGGAPLAIPEVETTFELIALAATLYDAPITATSFSAAALR